VTITLENAQLRLVVNPCVGGSVVRFDALTPAGNVPLMRPGSDDEQDPNQLAMYPLVPWSNRIAKGGFEWRGQHYSLAPNLQGEPLPIHGDGWQRPWQVMSQSHHALHLELYSNEQPPFDYRAELSYCLAGNCLEVALSVMHLGDNPAPYGLGLHPWFPRTTDARITAPAKGVWEVNKAQLPIEWRRLEHEENWNFSHRQSLPETLIDNLFTGWSGQAQLEWSERSAVLAIDTSPPMSRYLVFSPNAQADFFCLEPVSHTVDAHHNVSPFDQGLVELAKGQSIAMMCRFCYQSR